MSVRLKSLSSIVSCLFLGCTLILTPPAAAQSGAQAAFQDAFIADFSGRDVSLLSDVLDLEDWQQAITEGLFSSYMESFNAGVDDVKGKMGEVRKLIGKGDNRQIMDQVMRPVNEWLVQKRQLREELIADIKNNLSASQLEQWPKFEMAFNREKLLGKGELSGESVNIFTIVREMQLDPAISERVERSLAQYELDLDASLLAREQEIVATTSEISNAMRENDYAAMSKLTDRIMAKRIVIRTVQENSADAIASAMPAELGEKFLMTFKSRAFPRAYREPLLTSVFNAAKRLDDLTEQQLVEVLELESSYRTENNVISEHVATLIKAQEPLDAKRKFEAGGRRDKNATRDDESMRVAGEKKEDLAKRTLDSLKAILTPEQFAKLPKISFTKAVAAAKAKREMAAARKNDPRLTSREDALIEQRQSGKQSAQKQAASPTGQLATSGRAADPEFDRNASAKDARLKQGEAMEKGEVLDGKMGGGPASRKKTAQQKKANGPSSPGKPSGK